MRMLDGELNTIDIILENLSQLKNFYGFERAKLEQIKKTFIDEQSSILTKNPQLKSNGVFKSESDQEIEFLNTKINILIQRIDVLDKDIQSRNESKTTLIALFNSLNSTSSLNFDNEGLAPPAIIAKPIISEDKELITEQKPAKSKPSPQAKELPLDELLDLPVMEIREELDENGDVISSEVKPFKSNDSIEELLKAMNNKKQSQLKSQPLSEVSKTEHGVREEIDEDGNIIKSSFKLNKKPSQQAPAVEDGFRPFMIREEIDENGDVIEGSISQIPDLKADEDNGSEGNVNEDDEQLAELFMDMGLKVDEPSIATIEAEETYTEPLKDNETDTHPITEISREMYKPEIDPNDVITLEMIASELMNNDEAEEDEEWQEINNELHEVVDEEEEEEDDYDTKIMENMMGTQGTGLFMQQIMELRKKNAGQLQIVEEEINKTKTKKSVKFNSTVDVKPIENIWNDLRKSDYENQLNDIKRKNDIQVSKFKQNIHSEDNTGSDIVVNHAEEDDDDGEAILDIIERDIVDGDEEEEVFSDIVERDMNEISVSGIRPSVSPVIINQAEIQNQMDNYQTNFKSFEVQKVGRKPVSKFKMVRAANKGKEFQDTYISPEMKEQMREMADKMIEKTPPKKVSKLKKDFKSLTPSTQISHGTSIEIPKDVNPIINPNVKDEDYEIIRNEANDDLFDDDDEGPQEEFTPSGESFTDNRETDASSGLEPSPEPAKKEQTSSTYFPKYEDKALEEETEVVGATLDYSSLNGDVDSMAKAYVLGLYDDDIQTEGQVIEHLDDFEDHNREVETREELHGRVTELNDKSDGNDVAEGSDDEDDGPMVSTDIVENDIDEINEMNSIPIDQFDIELNDERLNQELVNDYTNMRKKMIYKYKGGFKETDEELEFVQPDEVKRVSRFKAARLGI